MVLLPGIGCLDTLVMSPDPFVRSQPTKSLEYSQPTLGLSFVNHDPAIPSSGVPQGMQAL